MTRDDTIDALKYGFMSPYLPQLSLKRPDWVINVDEKRKKRKEKEEQLNRIEEKLDKLLGPQLINGVWR